MDRLPQSEWTSRNFRGFNNEAFLAQLDSMNWEASYSTAILDDKSNILNGFLLYCFDIHAPLITVKSKALLAPWITAKIKTQMRNRDRACREWCGRWIEDTHNRFKYLRISVQVMIRVARSKHHNRIFSTRTSATSTWKELRSLGLIKSRKVS